VQQSRLWYSEHDLNQLDMSLPALPECMTFSDGLQSNAKASTIVLGCIVEERGCSMPGDHLHALCMPHMGLEGPRPCCSHGLRVEGIASCLHLPFQPSRLPPHGSIAFICILCFLHMYIMALSLPALHKCYLGFTKTAFSRTVLICWLLPSTVQAARGLGLTKHVRQHIKLTI
jgi:hypothetical protein